MNIKTVALAGVVGWATGGPALAQDAGAALQRVEITGSAVRRIDAETALPVQVIRHEDIVRSGATSTIDLLQRLPAVQGSVGETASVGGYSYGFTSVSLHGLDDTRTLVLLNGRRMAQFGGQTLLGFAAATDLSTIPLAAIDRVEILSDGASALYGSDAIAGVVNIITRRNAGATTVTLGRSAPRGGAKETRFTLSTGFGDLAEDGHNLLIAFSADRRTALRATSRSFARSGILNFSANGKRYQAFNGGATTAPANIGYDPGTPDDPYDDLFFNPHLAATGSCGALQQPYDGACYYDFSSQLQIVPQRDNQQLLTSYTRRLNADHTLFADLLLARSQTVNRIAPASGALNIAAGTPLHDRYVLPTGIADDVQAYYRVSDLGPRTDDNTALFGHVVLGMEGTVHGWDYNAAFTHSTSRVRDDIAGYPSGLGLQRALQRGLDPFVGAGAQDAAGQAALRGIDYRGHWDGGQATLDALNLNGSRAVGQLAGGPLMLAAGASLQREQYTSQPSQYLQGRLANPMTGALCDPANPALPCDQRFGDSGTSAPYSAGRNAWGVFTELVAPVTPQLELSAAARHDRYADFGGRSTGKASFRFKASNALLLRGSVGTGFRAPSVPQVNGVRTSYGATAAAYDCTPELQAVATSLGAQCRPGTQNYDVVAEGNRQLKAETSQQATLGLRLEPLRNLSLGADFWTVAIRNAFGQLSESQVFGNPLAYQSAFTAYRDPVTSVSYLALYYQNRNLGRRYASGVDLDGTARWALPIGALSSQLSATYMLRDKAQLSEGGAYYQSVGRFSEVDRVSFRWQGRVLTSLKAGDWTHSLGVNFKSGYQDVATDVEVLDASDARTGEFETVQLKVKHYATFDWQTQWQPTPGWLLTAGVLNLEDKAPPLSLATGGLNKGQMIGYDDRYYDARGRTLYVNASYTF